MQLKTIVLAVGLMATTALTGCSTIGFSYSTASYNSVVDAGYVIPAVPRSKIPPQYLRQQVNYDGSEAPGTIIVDTGTKYLYYVLGGGKAMRYGIGVGKQGFEWHGTARVAMKREWPTWTPPREMIQRQPKLAEFRDGMDPASPTRSAHGRFTCSTRVATQVTACMAHRNGGRSARPCLPAVSA